MLIGGAGRDVLAGGLGADRFVFRAADIGVGREVIRDFQTSVDLIDLRAIYAGRLQWVGAEGFGPGAAGVRAVDSATGTWVQADLDGDGRAEFQVMLTGAHGLSLMDFLF